MATVRFPIADLQQVRSGDPDAFLVALIALADRWFHLADSSVRFPVQASGVAALGANSKAGLLAAAVDLRELVAQSPQGREALRDFGFEPVFRDVEGE